MMDIIQNIIGTMLFITVWATCIKYLFTGVKSKPKEYRYHVAYYYVKGTTNGNGSTTATVDGEINTSERLKWLASGLCKELGNDSIVITNIIPLKG